MKPAFRAALKRRRRLVVAAGIYEWRQGDKVPHYITLRSGERMPFTGLWETFDEPEGKVDRCTICTTEAKELMGRLHTRVPITLPRGSIDPWLDPRVSDVA